MQAATPPGKQPPQGGGAEKGVVDQVGEGQGHLPAPPGGGAKGGYLQRARLLVPILVRAETPAASTRFQAPPLLPSPPPSPRPPLLPASLRFGLPSPSAPSALLDRAARFHTRHWPVAPSISPEPHPAPHGVGPPYPARNWPLIVFSPPLDEGPGLCGEASPHWLSRSPPAPSA